MSAIRLGKASTMNNQERKYRFTEIMSTVSLLPDIEVHGEPTLEEAEMMNGWVLPNRTAGLMDDKIKDAILCQAFREDEGFKFKLVALLSNSAIQGISEARIKDTKPSDEDLQALAISANILWAEGQAKGLFQLLGMLGSICTSADVELPTLSTLFLRSNGDIERYGKLDPIAILEGNVTYDNVKNALSDGE